MGVHMGRRAAVIALLCGGAAGFSTVVKPALRSPGACASAQRRAAPTASLMMNANNLEKIVVCTGPTCTKNGGGKKLKKIVEEMAAPLGIEVEAVKCVSDCAECGLGPNLETHAKGAEGPFPGKIFNNVKTAADVARILRLPSPTA